MTTELEPYRDTLGHPEVLNTAVKLAGQIANTDFVPKAFRGKPEAVMAALLTGREIGLGPMTALQRIHVIEGKASLDAQGMRAQLLAAGHDMWIVDSTPERCTVGGRRRGSDHEQTVTWTMADARTAGLANKAVWKAYPRQMLQARATAELCRLIAPDALGGMAYSSEELEDQTAPQQPTTRRRGGTQEAPDSVTVTTRATIPQQATTAPATQPSWDDDDVVDAEVVEMPARGKTQDWSKPAPTESGEMATNPQISKISILFNRLGWDDPTIDTWISNLSGGRTQSRKELTKTEASTAIEELQALESEAS